MSKKHKFIIFITLWLIAIAIFYISGVLTIDASNIGAIIKGNPIKMQLIFIFLSTIRVIFFIPQTVFILVGSIIFGPYIGFILSLLSLILSQSIMYFVGRYFNKQLLGNFLNKNSNILEIIKQYGYKILALGIICPVTPSDLITASAGCIKLNYKKCISVIAAADAPMIFLYCLLGTKIEGSYLIKVLVVLAISFISYYSFVVWNKINKSI